MMHLKYIGILLLVLGVSGGTWLHEHDKTVKYRALSEKQSEQLKRDVQTTEGLLKAVASLDTALAKSTREFETLKSRVADSTKTLQNTIDKLAHEIERELPESTKTKVAHLVGACKQQSDMLSSALSMCDVLRRQSQSLVARRDTIIWGLQRQRDGYRRLWETAPKNGRTGFQLWIERIGIAGGFYLLGHVVK